MAAVTAAAMLIGSSGTSWAAPATPAAPHPLPAGWSVRDGKLTWTSPRPVGLGDARVEFYSGNTPLGAPESSPDGRTFQLALPNRIADLQVRAGGRRLDGNAPAARRGPAAAPKLPALTGPAAVDPGTPGPYRTIKGEYALPDVKLPGFPAKVEMRAVVVAPRGAPGNRPLALFLHGRHITCYNPADENEITIDWPCVGALRPVPSYRGYPQAQQLLASQGYVTVSISANGVNGQDNDVDDLGAQARSSLVRLHLADWANWAGRGRGSAPAIVRAAPRADLSRVFLMGHSRGGEGVNRAALDSLSPPPAAQDGYHGPVRWTIRGLLLIGPTIFGHDPAPDVPSATILPGCDGDVADLQGQMYADATRGVSRGRALHSALYVIGANHNYFNSEWTPGRSAAPSNDDFFAEDDPLCSAVPGSVRLTPWQQEKVGAVYIAAAARLFVAGDERARPLLDGSGARARSADPARVLSHAIGGARTAALVPDRSVRVTNGRICSEVTPDDDAACLVNPDYTGGSPHFVSFSGASPDPDRYAVRLTGTGTATVKPARPVSLGDAKALALRLIVPPNSGANTFRIGVLDPRGHRTTLGTVRAAGLPGTDNTTSYWAQELRVPVPRGLGAVAAIEITRTGGTGPAWLIDAWGWRPGTPAPLAFALPRVDVGVLTVDEGDSGTKKYQVPVRMTGRGHGRVRVFYSDPVTQAGRSFVADVGPGTSRITVPVSVTGNDIYGGDERIRVSARALRNTVVGHWNGGVDVLEDDPMPTITITPDNATAVEGRSLTWTVKLSAPTDVFLFVDFTPKAPGTGEAELSTTDVDPAWFTENSGENPAPSRPLSQTGLTAFVPIEPGTTSAELTIPIVADRVAEPAERVRFQALVPPAGDGDLIPLKIVTGTVTDN